ncbi:MAG: hypothetical protein LBL66_10730 [Clostridiales bacterium]|jgi:hypothetical protein|nr:hypothetical protein [Clostridiales bacterium]
MVKKIIGLGVLLMMIFSLVGCGNKYNAVMYDNAKEWVSEEFLRENLTRGILYEDVYLDDNSYPKNITHIIKNQEDFDTIFTEFPSGVNFESSMVCVYVFTCNYMGRAYKISKIRVDDQVLKIDVASVRPKKIGAFGDASIPQQRCLVVKMAKHEITAAEFTERK